MRQQVNPGRPTTAARLARAAVPMGVTMTLLGGVVPSAVADDPRIPTAGRVRQSKDQVAHKAAQVAAAQARYRAASAEIVALDARAGLAVERYDGAMVALDRARRAADVARQRQHDAEVRLTTATSAVGDLAAQAYRAGGLAGLSSLITSDGPGSLYDRATELRSLSRLRAQTLRDSVAAQRAATARRRAADAAAAAQRAATDRVRAAKDQAQTEVQAEQREIARIQAERDQLLAQLAAARRSSVELERQRQQALAELDAERAARARADADARAGRRRGPDGVRLGGVAALLGLGVPAGPANPRAAQAVAYAMAQLGKPYVWGGAGPDTFDCSGLTMRAWQRAGVRLNHFAADQYAQSRPVALGGLRIGDLVFWTRNNAPSGIYHVGIYLGGGRMIEAPRTGDVVKVASLYIIGAPDYFARP